MDTYSADKRGGYDFDVAVIGLGRAGLLKALRLHAAGNRVLAVDLSGAMLIALGAGLLPLSARRHQKLAAAMTHPRFQLSGDLSMLSQARTIYTCPTGGMLAGFELTLTERPE
ncbi:MAG: hypothetical protein ABIN55_01155 [Aeromicrobium sp.]